MPGAWERERVCPVGRVSNAIPVCNGGGGGCDANNGGGTGER